MWGSRPLLTVSTADRSILHSAKVVHFHHSSRKSSEELWTQHTCADHAQYHTSEVWLHRDATKPLQRYAEDQQPATVTAAERTITLPSGQHLSKGCYPKRTGLYPFNSSPLCSFRIRLSDNSIDLINWLSQSHMGCGCTVFLGGSPCSD
jgi:hypothetical protein